MSIRLARKVAIVTLVGSYLFLLGCLQSSGGSGSESGAEVVYAPPLDSLVCDPFANEHQLYERRQGVKAHMYYKPLEAEGTWDNLSYYFNQGISVDSIEIYLSHIFVPTRPFNRGFYTQTGELVTTESGNTLYEWFALQLEGFINLGEQLEGQYQLAILSDDGAILNLQNDAGEWVEFINNDGNHPTKMKCASEPISMSAGGKLPYQINYYQGPRYHISLMLMWRPWPEGSDGSEMYCNKYGNSLFFDSTQDPPEPQPAFYDLESRGWRVLSPDQYEIPETVASNPCNQEPAIISNVVVVDVTSTSITMAWETDYPATSQVKATNVSTNEILSSQVDQNLTTSHTMTVEGLTSATKYDVTVKSMTTSGAESQSTPLQVFTRR